MRAKWRELSPYSRWELEAVVPMIIGIVPVLTLAAAMCIACLSVAGGALRSGSSLWGAMVAALIPAAACLVCIVFMGWLVREIVVSVRLAYLNRDRWEM